MTLQCCHSGLDKPALACPVLDTGYLIRGGNDSSRVIVKSLLRHYTSSSANHKKLGAEKDI